MSSPLSQITARLSDKGLGRLLLALASLVAVFGASYYFLDLGAARSFQAYAGYYFCMAALLCAGLSLFKTRWWLINQICRLGKKTFLAGLGLAALGTYLMLLHEPSRMRVFADEPTHALTAQSMAQERHVYYPSVAYFESGSTVFGEPEPAYRHYFYPFVVSLLHNLTGVRTGNFFIANAIIGFLTLAIVFLLGCRIGGSPLAGFAAQLLLLSLPLLHHTLNSAGYDPLNLLCFSAFILACFIYLQNGGLGLLNLSISLGILLAYCRSESIIYMTPLAIFFLIRSIREGRFNLSWFSIISPVFLLVPIAARKIANNISYNLSLFYDAGNSFFSLNYFESNARDFVAWLFSSQSSSLNSSLISGLGGVSLIGLLIVAACKIGPVQGSRISMLLRRIPAADLVTVCFVALSGVHLFLILCLYWNPTTPSAVRFFLPFLLVLILCIVRFFYWVGRATKRSYYGPLILIAVVFSWMVTLPKASRAEITKSMIAASEAHGSLNWVKANDDGRTLYAVNSPAFFFLNQIPVITLVDLGTHPRPLFSLIEEGYFDQIIIIETLLFSPKEGNWAQTEPKMPLPPNLILEPVDSWRGFIHAETSVRRVLGLTSPDGSFASLPRGAGEPKKWESNEAYFKHIRKLQFFRRYAP